VESQAKLVLSIITVVLNNQSQIARCISSVQKQKHINVEHIVIDGGSTDGTLDVIDQFSDGITFSSSEPDRGIAHAFNKGLKQATGDYVLFLNSDDYYANENALSALKCAAEAESSLPDIVCSPIIFSDPEKTLNYVEYPRPEKLWHFMTVFHPSMMVKRALFNELGDFDEGFKYAMDSEWAHRAFKLNKSFVCIEEPIAVMQLRGVSDREKVKSQLDFFKSARLHSGRTVVPFYYFARQLGIHYILKLPWLKKLRIAQRGNAYSSKNNFP